MIDYTTIQLLKDIRRTGSIPSQQGRFDNEDFLAFANDVMQRTVVTNVLKAREEFFVHGLAVPATTERHYDIPERATGERIRQVQILDANGKVILNVQRLEPIIAEYDVDVNNWNGVFGYFFQDNQIVFTNAPSNTGAQVNIKFYRRPGKLVEVTDCAKVVDVNGNVVTVESIPSGWQESDLVDFVNARPPFNSKGDSVRIDNISGTDITFTDDVTLVRGDYIAPEGCSPIPQIPVEIHPILVQYVKLQLMDAIGDPEAFDRASKQFTSYAAELFELIQDRDDGSPRKAVSPNGLWAVSPTRFWRF